MVRISIWKVLREMVVHPSWKDLLFIFSIFVVITIYYLFFSYILIPLNNSFYTFVEWLFRRETAVLAVKQASQLGSWVNNVIRDGGAPVLIPDFYLGFVLDLVILRFIFAIIALPMLIFMNLVNRLNYSLINHSRKDWPPHNLHQQL